MIAAIEVIVTTIIAGLILLIFEHWTGWFSEQTRLSEIRLAISQWITKSFEISLKFFRSIKDLVAIYTYLLVIYGNYILLTPEAQTNKSLRSWLLAVFALIAFGTPKLMNPPMAGITVFLLVLDIVVAFIFVGPPGFASLVNFNWRMFFDVSDPDLTDVRTVSMIVTLLMFFVFWVVADIISRHVGRLETRIDEKISLLLNAPGITLMLKAGDEELYNSIVNQWGNLLEHFRKQNNATADLMQHYVPLRIRGYCLYLGCKTLTDVSRISDPVQTGKRTSPPRKFQIERSIQEFFNNHFLTITAEKIDGIIFEQIWRQINQLEKKDSG